MGNAAPHGSWVDRRMRIAPLPPGIHGDPGLFGPGSMVWRIGRERVLVMGGAAALLMQLAHPLVAEGVRRHSGYRRDPFQRLGRTLGAVLDISFGDRAQVEAAVARVRGTHTGVRGLLAEGVGDVPAGSPYDATDPHLAMWVHATLVATAIATYEAFVGPLGPEGRTAYFQESKRFGALFAADDRVMPATYADFEEELDDRTAAFARALGPGARALAADVLSPPLPRALRPAGGALRASTGMVLPPALRRAYGLGDPVSPALTGAAVRGVVRTLPSAVRYWPAYHVARARCSVS